MSNGVIDIRENEINNIKNHINKSSTNISNFSSSLTGSFQDINAVGLLKKCVSEIGNQVNIISNQAATIVNNIYSSYRNMEDVELVLKDKASLIESPTDFAKNDSSMAIGVNAGNLNSDNGKAINSNNYNDEKELNFQNVINYNEKLKKIVKDYEDINGEIEINADSIVLGNILKEQEDKDYSLEEYEVSDVVLERINKEVNENVPELNDSFEVEKVYLDDDLIVNASMSNNYIDVRKCIRDELNNGKYLLKKYKE